jgi:hypothetical protein
MELYTPNIYSPIIIISTKNYLLKKPRMHNPNEYTN